MSKRKGYGKIIRPCNVCTMPINFVLWQTETERRKRRIWHWANPDGTHHVHCTLEERKRGAMRKHESLTADAPS